MVKPHEILRHVIEERDGQAFWRCSRLPCRRRKNRTIAIPWQRTRHHSRHPRRCALNLYLRSAAELRELTKRTTFIRVQEQENNVYGRE